MGTLKIIDDHEVCDQQLRTANKRADKAEADLDRAYERYDKAEQDRNHWHDKAQEYRQQSVEYRESRDKWCEAAVREQLATKDTLPRVIADDEVRPGQQVAAYHVAEHMRHEWISGPVSSRRDGIYISGFRLHDFSTVVLLADALDDDPSAPLVMSHRDPFRGTPVRPQSIRAGDLYDIHTAHGSRITGVVAARNGVRNPQNGDHYRLVQAESSRV